MVAAAPQLQERVRPDIWRVPAAWRPGRRPVRAAPHVYRWAGPVRVCVVTRRPGAQRVAPDRGADTARGRSGRTLAGRVVAGDVHLHRWARATPSAGYF